MRAEIILRLTSDPNAVCKLENAELRELLADPEPPAWVFAEAARRTNSDKVVAHLFSHPAAELDVLENSLRHDARLLERFQHHVEVFKDSPTFGPIFVALIPEASTLLLIHPQLAQLLIEHLSPLCLKHCEVGQTEAGVGQAFCSLTSADKADKRLITNLENSTTPRHYSPLTRVMFLGDFFFYLLTEDTFELRDLPILAQVALALNPNQTLEPFLDNVDVRVRLAAKERQSWNMN